MGNVNNKAHLILHSLHLHMCHSLHLYFSRASEFRLLAWQSGDVCEQGTSSYRVLWASSVDTVLAGFSETQKRYISKSNFVALHGKGSMASIVAVAFNCKNLLFSWAAKCKKLKASGTTQYCPIFGFAPWGTDSLQPNAPGSSEWVWNATSLQQREGFFLEVFHICFAHRVFII